MGDQVVILRRFGRLDPPRRELVQNGSDAFPAGGGLAIDPDAAFVAVAERVVKGFDGPLFGM